MIKLYPCLLLTAFLAVGSFSQITGQNPAKYSATKGTSRTLQKGMGFPDFPQLGSNVINLSITLPSVVDNSTQPYLRSAFQQAGASCGQSASVGYNFCYEINRLRQLPSDTISNTYPDHFTWNFMNGTLPYYGEGVSYFHTFDILYDAGNPTEEVYGRTITVDDSYYWMSGYEKYFSAMHNRISGANSIHAGTPEGLEILKHWLHNHLEGSEVGGVANFYAGVPNYAHLPPNSPEAGKAVITTWMPNASHAMTIVGYNDSIRFDINGDGMFSNDLDNNNDGVVDMRDWEIGGLKFINSYGNWFGDEGFCYMLYSSLAIKYGQGGIWNNSVHVLFPDTAYKPQLTIKASVKHNKRGRLKISAGISTDTSRYVPDYTMDFSIFNYQGLDYYMAGNKLPEGKTIEFGLDISPLLSYVQAGQATRIFLIVDEKDIDSKGDGFILDFQAITHTGTGEVIYVSNETPAAIINHGRTIVTTTIINDSEPPAITIDEFHLATPGNTNILTAVASGGEAPYEWTIEQIYYATDSIMDYPEPEGETLIPTNNSKGYSTVALPFTFPFFGQEYDTVFMHVNGYIMFLRADMPYYYLLFDEPYLRQFKAIAGCMHHELGIKGSGDYLKASISDDKAILTWKISALSGAGIAEFSITLTPDGVISIQYGDVLLPSVIPVTGISSGKSRNYIPASRNGILPVKGEIRKFTPALPANILDLVTPGIIHAEIPENFASGQFKLQITDSNRLKSEKIITLTTGPLISIELADSSALLSPGSNILLTVKIRNACQQDIENSTLEVLTGSSNLSITGQTLTGLNIPAGETVEIKNQFSMLIADSISSQQPLRLQGTFVTDGKEVNTFATFSSSIPLLVLMPPVVQDNDNNTADPGEEVAVVFSLYNPGNADAGALSAELTLDSPFAALTGSSGLLPGELDAFSLKRIAFQMKVNDNTPPGTLISITLNVSSENAGTKTETYTLDLGMPQIVVIDKDKNQNSAVHIVAAINQINLSTEMLESIDPLLNDYKVAFLSLGFFMQNHRLTPFEDSLLVSFLNNGGKLYLEGGAFFKQDPVTDLRGKLGVTGLTQAWAKPADTLIGIEGTPAEEFMIDYRGDAVRGENLIALEPAETWMSDKNSDLNFVVALDSGTYKTIASSVEFGGFFMYNSPGRTELIRRYLDFLDFATTPLCVTFQSSAHQICPGNSISFTSGYSKLPLTWNWSFPGGTPDTWNGPQPEIQYKTAGTYDVSLTVSEGIESNTFFIENMITVNECLGMQEVNTHRLKIYPNPASDKLTIESESIIGLAEISLLDSKGMEVFRQVIQSDNHSLRVSLPQLKAGFYILRLNCGNKITWSKLIIQ
jgi:hypothetical protein